VTACAVTPNGRAWSRLGDKTLKVWDLERRGRLATLQGHAPGVLACAVTPDGRRVVSASDDKTLKVWDLASGQAVVTLQGHADRVLACAVTRTGGAWSRPRMTRRSRSGTWRRASRRTLQGHAARVLACAVTPDGRRVVSASDDKTLKVWDLASGQAVATCKATPQW
jgi:WD40 repeat protein